MKANVCQQFAGALLCLAGGLTVASAQAPARSQGTPIIFSNPSAKQSGVSSNLTELRKPQAPFRNLESDLKGPQNIFRPAGNENVGAFKPVVPNTPVLNRKSAKDLLNEQAEAAYLSSGTRDSRNGDDSLFGLEDKSFDPYKQSPRNSLELYYDRMDRARGLPTNSAAASNPFGSLKDSESDKFGLSNKADKDLRSGNSLKNERNPNSSALLPNADDSRSSSQRMRDVNGISAPKPLFGNSSTDKQLSARETRMEDFKRLLEGSRYSGPARDTALSPIDNYRNYNPRDSVYGGSAAARQSAAPVVTPSFSSTRSTKPDPQQEFVKSANLIGDPSKPESLTELKAFPSLNDTPPIQPPPTAIKPTTSTFKVPKRRF